MQALAPRLHAELAETALASGLAVTQSDGSRVPIPITATPVVIDPAVLRDRARLAAHISAATTKLARWAVNDPAQREPLLSMLLPLERELCIRTSAQVHRLATARVDFFVPGWPDARPRALEVNATIPAMQAYSDLVAEAFIRTVGTAAGLGPGELAALCDANVSNTRALYHALLAGYAKERPGRRPERIAVLLRRNDAQLTEQTHLARRFTALGTPAEIVYPDELTLDDKVRAHGQTFDLVYRHLFVRRLAELGLPQLEQLYAEVPGTRAVLLNPPASHIELKAVFGLLSQAAMDPALAEAAALTGDELAAVASAVPWTRLFRRGPQRDPDGEAVGDLVARVAAEPARFVLKRAWDYGGKAVFLGHAAESPAFAARVRAAFGAELTWPALCERAADDPVGFVVQELVQTTPEPHLLCLPEGLVPRDLYVDFSAYASVGLDEAPDWGGCCRGSVSQIVNIASGGGLIPLLTTPVANALSTALTNRPT